MIETADRGPSSSGSGFLHTEQSCRYAGLGRRFWALLLDLIVFCSVFFPITRLVKGVWLMEASDHRWVRAWFITDPICIVFFVVMCLYYVVLEARFGVTLGKLALRIRVIEISSGGVPGWRRSMIRNALRLVDGLPALNLIGVILILATPEKTRVGDLVAQTRVVINQR